ncbi:hypothetical protein F444_03081 [Phytophthora nicotianae P1976]|uniref:Uncharacterized protein n=1 Tax=Phytophthora nicotianae P1976 TaxID=1317066 RepID=A0A081AVB3_PHYNI|nr:hypothetical protein F444_03081 [Phytophthora nicotianae P1976]
MDRSDTSCTSLSCRIRLQCLLEQLNCRVNAVLFVPCGLTEAEVGRAVVVDEELAATDISPTWHQLVSIWSSDSDSTEVSSAAEDEDQGVEEIQSSQDLNALASTAASATP